MNEATAHYLWLIEQSVQALGCTCERIYNLRKVSRTDIIITVEAKDFCRAQLFRYRNRKINWFQGITPEEALMQYGSVFRKRLWELFEFITLSGSSLNLFVSEAMQEHYKTKYKYHKANYLVIPCYNSGLNKSAFFIDRKYITPSFVYTGSLSSWQCIDQVLEIFRNVQLILPSATFTMLTAEPTRAAEKVAVLKIPNISIKYVPLTQLSEELKNYKYGFLIREENQVNEVATPTKMNTYLANGIIPVFTDVVAAFKKHIYLGDFELRLSPGSTPQKVAEKVVRFEDKIIDPHRVLSTYSEIFSRYYNDKYYITLLKEALQKLCSQ